MEKLSNKIAKAEAEFEERHATSLTDSESSCFCAGYMMGYEAESRSHLETMTRLEALEDEIAKYLLRDHVLITDGITQAIKNSQERANANLQEQAND